MTLSYGNLLSSLYEILVLIGTPLQSSLRWIIQVSGTWVRHLTLLPIPLPSIFTLYLQSSDRNLALSPVRFRLGMTPFFYSALD